MIYLQISLFFFSITERKLTFHKTSAYFYNFHRGGKKECYPKDTFKFFFFFFIFFFIFWIVTFKLTPIARRRLMRALIAINGSYSCFSKGFVFLLFFFFPFLLAFRRMITREICICTRLII